MMSVGHSTLESITNIIDTKRHDAISEITPSYSKSCFVPVLRVDMDLIIAREVVHKGYDFMVDTCWFVNG